MSEIPRNKDLKQLSRNLRNNTTKQENHLWYDFLKLFPLQFYRQRIIGNYIVDFYCPKAKLVIELDGSQHFEDNVEKYDEERTKYLESLELIVLRFSNNDINNNFNGVCEKINETALFSKEGGIAKGYDG